MRMSARLCRHLREHIKHGILEMGDWEIGRMACQFCILCTLDGFNALKV
jgi:hypothetical protein